MQTGQSRRNADITADLLRNASTLQSALFMAADEMHKIKAPDLALADPEIASKFVAYFGQDDRWAPLAFLYTLKTKFPECNWRVCNRGMPHAFVLEHGREMAEVMEDWLKEWISVV